MPVIQMPKLSPTMERGTIATWHKREGDPIETGDLLFEVATDKATIEFRALDPGYLRQILVENGGEALVGMDVAIFTETPDEEIIVAKKEEIKEAALPKKEEVSEKPSTVSVSEPQFIPEPPLENYVFERPLAKVNASPLAKKLAKEKGLDLSSVKGSGPGGRIVSRDLDMAQKAGFQRGEIDFKKKPGSFVEEPISQVRQVIAKRLQEAKSFIPHFYIRQKMNAEPLVRFREELKEVGVHVTVNDCIVRASALALVEHPKLNSCFHSEHKTLVCFETIDVCVAVSLSDGLITPIIRYANYKSLQEISLEVRSLAKKARSGKLELHEFRGGSFTVTNLGMYGVTDFQAILNPPQAGVLAVSGIREAPVLKKGHVVPGKVMNITLSVDHRIIDGVLAAQFIKTLQKYIENPTSLLL